MPRDTVQSPVRELGPTQKSSYGTTKDPMCRNRDTVQSITKNIKKIKKNIEFQVNSKKGVTIHSLLLLYRNIRTIF